MQRRKMTADVLSARVRARAGARRRTIDRAQQSRIDCELAEIRALIREIGMRRRRLGIRVLRVHGRGLTVQQIAERAGLTVREVARMLKVARTDRTAKGR